MRCPFYRDPWALIEHGIAGIVRVSRCEDARVALEASVWLIRYAEALLGAKRAEEGNAAAIAELRALYSKDSRGEERDRANGAANEGS
jgi:CO/xanthine dehydrogenase FAD-binding subunit